MTITLQYLRQPSKAQYLMALLGLDINGVRIHWRLCARIINTYRRGAKNDLQVKEHFETSQKEKQQKKDTSLHSRRRIEKTTLNQNQGSKHNFKVCNALKPIVRLTSAGKGRPTRRIKKQFKSNPITVHLRGSKYTSGHQLF